MTIRKNLRSASGVLLGTGLLLAALVGTAGAAATITIINNDGAGEGFNDPAPRAPVGGNPAVTLGTQRLFIFNHAAGIWGSILTSAIPIDVTAQMNPQTCNATSAVLGSAGPTTVHRDFAGAPVAGHWYHQALANKISGTDLAVGTADINATFNSQLDSGACLGGLVWYYGTDGNEGVNVEMLPVVLHELGHGLGFSTTTSGSTGNFLSSFPAIWDKFLYGNAAGLHWDQMTGPQRQASAIDDGNLVWDGPAVTAAAPLVLVHPARFRVISPGGIAGTYPMVPAAFGGTITPAGVTGSVVLATDAVGAANDGCDPLTNGPALAGNIALIDRGTCTFVIKAQAAQAAGAIAVIIANNAAGLPPNPLGGSDASITIPVIGISQADGATIKANLPGVTVTIDQDPSAPLAGADASGKVQLYAPTAFAGGSSVSHYDVRLTPNALMEPFINNDLHNTVDMTRDLFQDIGWFPGSTATALALFTAEGRADGIVIRWLFNDQSDVASITLERAKSAQGPWSPISTELGREGTVTTALDTSIEPGQTYFYHLNVMDRAGHTSSYGLTSGQRLGSFAGGVFLGAPSPNPMMANGASVLFRISQPEYVRLSVLDASGRKVRMLQEGMMAPGQYTGSWDGLSDRSSRVAPGVYFLSLSTASGTKTQRIAVVQ